MENEIVKAKTNIVMFKEHVVFKEVLEIENINNPVGDKFHALWEMKECPLYKMVDFTQELITFFF